RLLRNLFFKNSPLHDGAVILTGDRVVAARCTLPITQREDIPPQFGMRHKAAIGMSEQSDASIIVVSEETGGISLVSYGQLTEVGSISELRLLLDKTDNG
ncbi:MAG: DNA integrity scanning protein DisA nucleotide-binding domain protein, partial [Bacteroidales bacterium]|nr:DNA integrity scanning protein DisA nucleotide-binding domain protein [Bacteroidales bacterium]